MKTAGIDEFESRLKQLNVQAVLFVDPVQCVFVWQAQRRLTSYFPTEMAEPKKIKSKRVKRILNVIRNPDVPNVAVSPDKGTSTVAKQTTNKGKSTRGRKPKNSGRRTQDHDAPGGGFVSRSNTVTLPPEVELSESSSCSDDFNDTIGDDILRNIDLDALQASVSGSKNPANCVKLSDPGSKTRGTQSNKRNVIDKKEKVADTKSKKAQVRGSGGRSRKTRATKTAPRVQEIQLSESDSD